MEIIIKNGIVKIETRKKFNPGIEKFSLDDAKNIMALFNKENGSRIDIEVIDIDLFDETKAFEYDFSNNTGDIRINFEEEVLLWTIYRQQK